jgi:hypothetical protein
VRYLRGFDELDRWLLELSPGGRAAIAGPDAG